MVKKRLNRMKHKTRLNLGAGNDIQEEYINQDLNNFEGIDDVFDFNKHPWKYKSNLFEEVRIKHCVHCCDNLMKFMEEVYRISKPNAIITIEAVNFLSPINCQDPFYRTNIGFNTFDLFLPINKNGYYNTPATFEIVKRKWIFSGNKYLSWLNFLPNIFPRFYARFLYFYFPSNQLYFELKVIK